MLHFTCGTHLKISQAIQRFPEAPTSFRLKKDKIYTLSEKINQICKEGVHFHCIYKIIGVIKGTQRKYTRYHPSLGPPFSFFLFSSLLLFSINFLIYFGSLGPCPRTCFEEEVLLRRSCKYENSNKKLSTFVCNDGLNPLIWAMDEVK